VERDGVSFIIGPHRPIGAGDVVSEEVRHLGVVAPRVDQPVGGDADEAGVAGAADQQAAHRPARRVQTHVELVLVAVALGHRLSNMCTN